MATIFSELFLSFLPCLAFLHLQRHSSPPYKLTNATSRNFENAASAKFVVATEAITTKKHGGALSGRWN
jgi:hypothetical protein